MLEQADLVGERERLGLIVGDVDGRRARLPDQRGDLHPHPLAQVGVEVGQRLVAQDEAGAADEGPGQRDALLLAAGQLVRVAIGERTEADALEHGQRPGLRFGFAQVQPPQGERHVFPDPQMRPEGVVLEHHRQIAPVRRHVDPVAGDRGATDADLP